MYMYIVYLYSIVYIDTETYRTVHVHILCIFFNTCFVCCFAKLRFEGIRSCWCRARYLSSCSARIYTRPELKASAYLAGSLSRVSMFQVSELLRTSWKQRGYLARTRHEQVMNLSIRLFELDNDRLQDLWQANPSGHSLVDPSVIFKLFWFHTPRCKPAPPSLLQVSVR